MLRYPHHIPRKLGFIRYFLAAWMTGDSSQLMRKFAQYLERSPHPDQGFALKYDENFSAATTGTHLDDVWKWFLIRLLVDPDYGCVHVVNGEERATLTRLARQLLAEIDGDDDVEPLDIEVSLDWDPTEETHSVDKLIRLIAGLMLSDLEQDFEYKLARELSPCAAACWTGHNVPVEIDYPPLGTEKPESRMAKVISSGLAFLVGPILKLLDRLPPGPAGHYCLQVNWLMELMNVSWVPKTDREGELLKEHLTGDTTHTPEYLRLQRLRWVEPADYERMPATFRNIQAIRQILAQSEVAAAS